MFTIVEMPNMKTEKNGKFNNEWWCFGCDKKNLKATIRNRLFKLKKFVTTGDLRYGLKCDHNAATHVD